MPGWLRREDDRRRTCAPNGRGTPSRGPKIVAPKGGRRLEPDQQARPCHAADVLHPAPRSVAGPRAAHLVVVPSRSNQVRVRQVERAVVDLLIPVARLRVRRVIRLRRAARCRPSFRVARGSLLVAIGRHRPSLTPLDCTACSRCIGQHRPACSQCVREGRPTWP
jgi:hypothetical protein